MPFGEKSICPTSRRTDSGKRSRSIGHHAPDAPKPAIVCRATGLTSTIGRCAPLTVRGAVVLAPVVVLDEGFVEELPDEHATSTSVSAIARAHDARRDLV